MSRIDDFQGENSHLVECINALLDMDDAKALVPHGLGKGSHAYRMLTAASHRLSSATAKVERLEEVLDDIKYQAQTRITDGDEMGGRIWRIALVDILAEAIAALKGDEQ